MRMIHSRKPPKPIQPDSTGPAMGIQNTKRLHASRKRLSTKDCAALFRTNSSSFSMAKKIIPVIQPNT